MRRPRRNDLLLLSIGVVGALLIVEVGMRLSLGEAGIQHYRWPNEPEESARWQDHPFLPYVGRAGAEYVANVGHMGALQAHVRNNAWGFRSHEPPAEKLPRDYHVITLGGSTTWAVAAADNSQTWPELLGARLQRQYPERNVRVFNFGTQNATSAYSLVALSLMAVHLEPDLVIVYHGINDIYPAMLSTFRPDHAHFFRDLALDARWQGIQRMVPKPLLSSFAVTYITARWDLAIGANQLAFYVTRDTGTPIEGAESGKKHLRRNWMHLVTMDSIARGHGARALFSTFQFFDGSAAPNAWSNETLRDTFREHGLDYVDVDAALPDGDRTLQFDECHFTSDGEHRMAEVFFRAIERRGYIGSPDA